MKGAYSKSRGVRTGARLGGGERGGVGLVVKVGELKDRDASKDVSAEPFVPAGEDAVRLHHKLAGM